MKKEYNIRPVIVEDYATLIKWWESYDHIEVPESHMLPNGGLGGFVVEREGRLLAAGFLYFTNSTAVLLEWIISNPEYKNKDRTKAIETLIESAEIFCKKNNKKYMFSISKNKSLTEIHKKLNWFVDEKPSYEITKKIN